MNTKPMIHLGIALILLGSATLIYHSTAYSKLEKRVASNDSPAITDATNAFPLSPLAGVLLLSGGIVLVAIGVKKRP